MCCGSAAPMMHRCSTVGRHFPAVPDARLTEIADNVRLNTQHSLRFCDAAISRSDHRVVMLRMTVSEKFCAPGQCSRIDPRLRPQT